MRNSCRVPYGKSPRYFSSGLYLDWRFLRRGCLVTRELQEDLLQAHGGGPEFVEVPAGLDHDTCHIAANEAALLAFDFKYRAGINLLLAENPADSRHLLELVLYARDFEAALAACDFHQNGLCSPRAGLQITHRVRRHQLSLANDDDLLAGLLDLRKDVRAENNRVLAREILDQVASLVDLLGVQSGRRFIE